MKERIDRLEERLARLEERLAGERDTLPAPPVQTTWNRVAKGFTYYYEKHLKLAWYYGPHVQALTDIATWCDSQAKLESKAPDSVLHRLLKAFFGDDYARRAQYPPKLLAAQCARFYSPPVVKPEDEPDSEAINQERLRDHRRREQERLERKLQEQEQGAYKPSHDELEQLVAKIGKSL